MKNVNQIRTGNSLELFKIKNPDHFLKISGFVLVEKRFISL